MKRKRCTLDIAEAYEREIKKPRADWGSQDIIGFSLYLAAIRRQEDLCAKTEPNSDVRSPAALQHS